MDAAWQLLRDAGLPMDGARSATPPSVVDLAAALRTAHASNPHGRAAEALAAFVFAWHQHWPGLFSSMFGAAGPTLLDWAARQFTDDGRYLKLRRIALANLAHVL